MNLKAIAVAVPTWRVDNQQVETWCGIPAERITNRLGIEGRHFLRANESGTDLSERAVRKLCDTNPGLDLAKVGLLIVVTQNPDYRLPHNAALLQHRLDLSSSTASFDISLGCSGFVYALSVARNMMRAEAMSDALLVTCDPYSKCMHRENREVLPLFGDAATVTWLADDGNGMIGAADFGTDGSGAAHLIIRAGGAADPAQGLDGSSKAPRVLDDTFIQMNGRAVFNFMIKRIEASIMECLKRNQLSIEAIDYFVFHQASRFLIETLRGKLSLEAQRVPFDISETGNTVSSSIPITLSRMQANGQLRPGTKILVCGFGVGLSWATNYIHMRNANDTA